MVSSGFFLAPMIAFSDGYRGSLIASPTLITAGTRDVFLSNAVRLHRKLRAAGVPAELHVLEAAAHGSFAGTSPEEAELDTEMRLFCEKYWAAA